MLRNACIDWFACCTADPRGVLPYISYTGMCRWRGYGFQAIWSDKRDCFQAIWSGKGYGFQAIRSSIGPRLKGSLTKDWNQEQLRIFSLVEDHKIWSSKELDYRKPSSTPPPKLYGSTPPPGGVQTTTVRLNSRRISTRLFKMWNILEIFDSNVIFFAN